MNRVRAGYPGQLDDLAILRREPADTVCFLDKRSNRSLHHSSNFSLSLGNELPPLLTFKLAAGERVERPYPDSKSRVLPLDDPASHFQRYCFHAPNTQHRRLIDVVPKLHAIRSCTTHQFAVIASAFAIKLRRKLDSKTFEFNRLCAHNLGSSGEDRTPTSALKGPASWPLDDAASYLRVSEMCRKNQKPPICIGGSERLRATDMPPLHERTFPRSLPRKRGRCREAIGMGFAHHCCNSVITLALFLKIVNTQKWRQLGSCE
jgi:hypothetical protein